MSEAPAGRGSPASPGIAIGPAFVLRRERMVIPERRLDASEVEGEVERLQSAFGEARSRLQEIRGGMQATGLVGDIFDAQFLFLEDPTLLAHAVENIRGGLLNAEWALQRELRRLQREFEGIEDPYIRERASDAGFVVRRVQQALMGREPEGLQNAPPGVIVIASELSPGDMAQVTREQIAGFVTTSGSRTSHVAIMARSLEIPAVVGAEPDLLDRVSDGGTLIVDGRNGRVLIEPDEATIRHYHDELERLERLTRDLLRYVDLPTESRDGVRVALLANIEQTEEIGDALRYGAEGIGLFRTEYLYMNRSDLPSEDEQVEAYRRVLAAVAPREAVIRTLDLGGDKVPLGLGLKQELNPALGLRGVRMYQDRPEVFLTQLRALLRAGPAGKLKILVPMVSAQSEFVFARETMQKVIRELLDGGHEIDERVPLGVMIETPAAALTADQIAPLADFMSIGTNDLLQYTLAVDRTNERVAYLYEPLHPANLRMLQQCCQAARRAGIVLGMCGEMAGDPVNCWILLALGIGELSMAPSSIPRLRKILRESTAAEARELLGEVLPLTSPRAIRERVEERMHRRFPAETEALPAD